nr:MLO-like protein 3 isoform X2 [Elaeis guineensis]
MILGLLSLILAVVQRPISYICIPTTAADFMLPCSKVHDNKTNSSSSGHCASQGMVSLVSQQGIHQLHIFIFVLAVVHVLCGVVTMVLGRAKMRRWKAWEKETATTAYQVANDPMRFRFTRETSFGRRHINLWTTTSVYTWARCFFRQFYDSVDKVDYLTLRNGFISAHFSRHKTFNFQKYIKRSLDDDFKTVIRISPFMWFLMVIFMLIDIHGWYSYFWLSFLPLVIVLSVGTKLHMIIMEMALQLDKQRTVIGAPPVQPNDDLFWFGKPRLVLLLLHLTFFQNAFEFTFFIWIWYEFGLKSCYHENLGITIARVTIAVVVQFLSSYMVLPMYALVSQMGSDFKRSLLEDRTRKVLRRWHEDVRRKRRKQHPCKNTASFHTQDSRISMQTTA